MKIRMFLCPSQCINDFRALLCAVISLKLRELLFCERLVRDRSQIMQLVKRNLES